MAKTAKMGRASIFRGKTDGYRVQAIITKKGGKEFEERRRELARVFQRVTGHEAATISDADVVEFMARGADGTEKYLRGEQK